VSLSTSVTCIPAIALMTAVVCAEDRILGLAVTDLPQRSYDEAAKEVAKLGVRYATIPLQWDEIETKPGVYAPNPDWLAIAAAYYPTLGWKVALEINPIDTVADRRPAWLRDKPWDDLEVVRAFRALVMNTLAKSNGLELTSLAIGNEVDVLLGEDPSAWAAYESFLAQAIATTKVIRPDVLVGVKATFIGLSGKAATHIKQLNSKTDVVMFTYYPLDENFRARDPETAAATDVNAMVEAFPSRKIHLTEVGYPASETCAGGEAGQSRFVKNFFAAWDNYENSIKAVYWDWMTDISSQDVAAAGRYYGVNQKCFAEFIGTLGLETGTLKPKQAWQVFADEATRRFQ
jgi:hypothetical protein